MCVCPWPSLSLFLFPSLSPSLTPSVPSLPLAVLLASVFFICVFRARLLYLTKPLSDALSKPVTPPHAPRRRSWSATSQQVAAISKSQAARQRTPSALK
jgi:hypothetical protein